MTPARKGKTMTGEKAANGVVTYTQLFAFAGLIVIMIGGLLGLVISQHSASTHPGSFTRLEFQQFERRIDDSIDRVTNSVSAQGKTLDTILEEVRKK